MNMSEAELVSIGKTFGPQGLKGELKCEVSLPSNFGFMELLNQRVILKNAKGDKKEFVIENIRASNRGFILKFQGVDSIEKADELMSYELFLAKASLKQLPENEFFVDELLGLKIYDCKDVALEEALEVGEVKEVLFYPANHLLKIKLKDSPEVFLLPLVDEYVKKIDLEKKKIFVSDWQIFCD